MVRFVQAIRSPVVWISTQAFVEGKVQPRNTTKPAIGGYQRQLGCPFDLLLGATLTPGRMWPGLIG